MSVYALSITLYENGVECPTTRYSDEEIENIVDEIQDLWSPTYHSERKFIVAEDDDLVLVYRDFAFDMDAPIPEEWLTKVVRFGVKNDLKLVGDRIPLKVCRSVDIRVAFRPM